MSKNVLENKSASTRSTSMASGSLVTQGSDTNTSSKSRENTKAITDADLVAMSEYLRVLQAPGCIKLLRTLYNKPTKYAVLKELMGMDKQTQNSHFAYYLRRGRENDLVRHDHDTNAYYLTFKGIKTIELLECVDKIANMSMSNLDIQNAKIQIDLNKIENWFTDLLTHEIRRIHKDLKK